MAVSARTAKVRVTRNTKKLDSIVNSFNVSTYDRPYIEKLIAGGKPLTHKATSERLNKIKKQVEAGTWNPVNHLKRNDAVKNQLAEQGVTLKDLSDLYTGKVDELELKIKGVNLDQNKRAIFQFIYENQESQFYNENEDLILRSNEGDIAAQQELKAKYIKHKEALLLINPRFDD